MIAGDIPCHQCTCAITCALSLRPHYYYYYLFWKCCPKTTSLTLLLSFSFKARHSIHTPWAFHTDHYLWWSDWLVYPDRTVGIQNHPSVWLKLLWGLASCTKHYSYTFFQKCRVKTLDPQTRHLKNMSSYLLKSFCGITKLCHWQNGSQEIATQERGSLFFPNLPKIIAHSSVFQADDDVQWNACCAQPYCRAKLSTAHPCSKMATANCSPLWVEGGTVSVLWHSFLLITATWNTSTKKTASCHYGLWKQCWMAPFHVWHHMLGNRGRSFSWQCCVTHWWWNFCLRKQTQQGLGCISTPVCTVSNFLWPPSHFSFFYICLLCSKF